MCGIIAILSNQNVTSRLVQGLKRLEYRGYDSSGIATIYKNSIKLAKSKGKIANLEEVLLKKELRGNIGIAHTRWATHGEPSVVNAHPHISENLAVVHNGIIENYLELKGELIINGAKFISQTDSEVIPHLIEYYLKQNMNHFEAAKTSFSRLKGAYSIVVIFKDNPDLMIATKRSAPLIVGYNKDEVFVGSDSYSLSLFANKISYLEDYDIAYITKDKVEIYNDNQLINRDVANIDISLTTADRGSYAHFMLKEIYAQPKMLLENLKLYLNDLKLMDVAKLIILSKRINIVACGTSYHAALVAKYWFEELNDVLVNVDIASEFRYRQFTINPDYLSIFISQSGETADTIAALKHIKEANQKTLSIVNIKQSSMAIIADDFIDINAGIEIGVASTKAFTAQLLILALLSLKHSEKYNYIDSLNSLPKNLEVILNNTDKVKEISRELANNKTTKSIIFTARGNLYPIALEGALKFKELTYIPAEAIAAGELKHGTIALIDNNSIIIAIIMSDNLFEKTLSNLHEIKTRGGKIIVITDTEKTVSDVSYKTITIPKGNFISNPILTVTVMQLIAYYTALYMENDVDQPRNLAKSVTVE